MSRLGAGARTTARIARPAGAAALIAAVTGLALGAWGCHDVYVYPIHGTPGGGGSGRGGGGPGNGGASPGNGGTAGAAIGGGGAGPGGAGGGQPVVVNCPVSTLVGFATHGNGTTGGATGPTVVVKTLADLQTAAMSSGPRTIRVDGMFQSTGLIDVASDKTVEGVGLASGLTGGGLRVKEGQNVILRNLVIAKAVGTDAIQLMTTTNVWIDHCDLSSDLVKDKGYYDGLVDISHAADYTTISWTRFHDHYHASLVGHSNTNAAEDTGHLTVTYHHNLFDNTQSELPRVRFGRVHVFNNHFRAVGIYAIASQMGAQVLVERNVFETVVATMLTQYMDPMDGSIHETGNLFPGSGLPQITSDVAWTPPYTYADDWLPVDSVALVVDSCAGVVKP